MVTKEDIQMAYRLIMGREPENDTVIANHLKAAKSLADLRYNFLVSDEFHAKFSDLRDTHRQPLNWGKIHVDVKVPDAVLQAMIARIEGEFKHMGTTEPHWSVLTADRFKAAVIKENETEFFESGRFGVDDLRATAERSNIALDGYESCFELGCGVARATIWLAEIFDKVIGADISPTHLAIAKQTVERYKRNNITLLHLNSIAAIKKLAPFDVFFSLIVLQHNPPPLIAYLLTAVFEKLKPGGIAYFQVPTYCRDYRFDAEEYLRTKQPPGVPEMHIIPQPVLFEMIEEQDCQIIEVREDNSSGPPWVSNRILVQKKPGAAGSRPRK
jgi:SAM-dependent methyltransferase